MLRSSCTSGLPSGTQAVQAVLVEQALPGKQFLAGDPVSVAGLLTADETAPYCGDHLGLAVSDPALGE